MCEYCHSFPHLSGCPNAPEPDPVYICDDCGEDILPGDEYVDFYGSVYCMSYIENRSLKELVELFGGSVREAEAPEHE